MLFIIPYLFIKKHPARSHPFALWRKEQGKKGMYYTAFFGSETTLGW
jgi:hypothetical protein